ncbi:uncharacterized protein LOC135691266 [Rhopilema esculentum]|uniref:uncharacterized protein LOC135691266 n=1 Tax=Rhopilema esculentum TaxID=499914 RepID=UPI0031DD0510|eukprot:gene5266-415_t
MAEVGTQRLVKIEPLEDGLSAKKSQVIEHEVQSQSTGQSTLQRTDHGMAHSFASGRIAEATTSISPPGYPSTAFQPQYFTPTRRMDFVPTFCKTFELPESRSYSDENNTEDFDDLLETSDRSRSKWSRAQTDTLVNSWKDEFDELENNRNPLAWKRILRDINRKGGKKSMDQLKKKLRNLKDRFKEAKKRSKSSRGRRHFPKYYDIFNDLLGAREDAREEERERRRYSNEHLVPNQTEYNIIQEPAEPLLETQQEGSVVSAEIPKNNVKTSEKVEQKEMLPRRTKRKKASKSGASAQLIDFLGQMQRQQEESMKLFLEGIEKIEEKSRKHTEETLLKIANIFTRQKKKKKRKDDEESDTTSDDNA